MLTEIRYVPEILPLQARAKGELVLPKAVIYTVY